MNDQVPAADRVARLPGWAQEHIRSLTSQLTYAGKRLDDIEAQLDIAKGEEITEKTDTRLDLDDIAVALPKGARVIFHDQISIHPLDDGRSVEVILLPLGELTITLAGEDRVQIRKAGP